MYVCVSLYGIVMMIEDMYTSVFIHREIQYQAHLMLKQSKQLRNLPLGIP